MLVVLRSSEAGCPLLNVESIWPRCITGFSPMQCRLFLEGQDTQPTVLSQFSAFESNFLTEFEIELETPSSN